MKTRIFIVLFTLLVGAQFISAQRPKIGLTLSGGGAKGLAHIGILKAIDKAGLKVDYITGTSMGSIVGAMYAAGYSGEQIEEIVNQIDWESTMSGSPEYRNIPLHKKEDYENYSVGIPFRGLKPVLTTGLIESEEIWLMLSKFFFPVYDIKDFDDFNIPFKCVATDLGSGEAVVLDSGEITHSIRASMAIPGAFSAVDYKDTKLVDGGIVRNFPVKDVIDMGADFVIGVNLYAGLVKADELNSVMDVMYQVVNYRDAEDLKREKSICDFIIEPPLSNYSAGSFDKAEEIMKIGDEMGDKYYPYFQHLADSLNIIEAVDYNPYNRLPLKEKIVIDNIEIEGLERTSDKDLLQSLNLKIAKPYTVEELNQAFRRTYSNLSYKTVYYHIIPLSEGHCTLKCMVKENELNAFSIGLSYHSLTNAALLLNTEWNNLFFNRSSTSLKLNLGENWRLKFRQRKYLGTSYKDVLDVEVSGQYLNYPIYVNEVQSALFSSISFAINLNYYHFFSNQFGVGGGMEFEYHSITPNISAQIFEGDLRRNNAFLGAYYNSLDRAYIPTKGMKTEFRTSLGFNRQYTYLADGITTPEIQDAFTPDTSLIKIQLNHKGFHPITDKTSIIESCDFGYAINHLNVVNDQFALGGMQRVLDMQMPFVGLNDVQIQSHSVASVGFGIQYNVLKEFYVSTMANAACYNFSDPFKADMLEDAKYISGAGIGLAYYLSVLPLNFNLMYSPDMNELYSHVSIGFVF